MKPVWTPKEEQVLNSDMYKFMKFIEQATSLNFKNYQQFHQWSVSNIHDFWGALAQYLKIDWFKLPERIFDYPKNSKMLGGRWFPNGKLNYAKNLIEGSNPDTERVTSYLEGRKHPVRLTGKKLQERVLKLALALKANGVEKGDRLCGVLLNSENAIIAMLATTSLGAIWSSCSPDFGADGIVERFSQIKPKILFFSHHYYYNGKKFSQVEKIREAVDKIDSLNKIISINDFEREDSIEPMPDGWINLRDFVGSFPEDGDPTEEIPYEPMSFDDPLFIMFSSGTTGKPKCIIHSVGGTLLQHKKEHVLHSEVTSGTKFLYFTTCGWMMWNWMVSALGSGSSLVTYDGSLTLNNFQILWKILESEKVNVFGTSPKYLSILEKNSISPKEFSDLSELKVMLSTGSPLYDENFDFVFNHIKPDIRLSSISGGTDILSCFVLGNPMLPVYKGQVQCIGLGMDVHSWDENKNPLIGAKGELVCTKPFVSMPVGFIGDSLFQEKYRASYFEYYGDTEVWRHGDFVEISENGGVIIHGRSDATLNPGGVRIGTAEIYGVVEQLEDVLDSIAIGVEKNQDTEIILFIKIREGSTGSFDSLKTQIKKVIKEKLSPRHIPALIQNIKDIPYTKSGKKMEMAVKKSVLGEPIVNLSSCANPESLLNFNPIS